MEKDKKSVAGNLTGRMIAFSGLSGFAIILIPFMLYFVFFFGVVSILSFLDGRGDMMALFLALSSLLISIATIYIAVKGAKQLWAQWQRKRAIDVEEVRVSRLMDDSSVLEEKESREENIYSDKKQTRP